ncbi:MAG: phosphoenolpyruvate--protein phosphotransferase, partial [Kiritimatiellae bacterium]|nr:phosphoenolpyruvate--protein phosphotransferase [Kiritimatiellia bacterium]
MDTGAPPVRAASATATVVGLATSRGFAAGPAFIYSKDNVLSVPEYAIAESAVDAELARYRAARDETRRQVEELVAKFKADTDGLASDVLSNHLLLVDDPTADAAVERRISVEHLNAEAAIRHTADDFRAIFAKMRDPYLRERQRDVEDVENRMLRILLDRDDSAFDRISEPVVVVADDLTPSETVTLPRDLILGFATNRGSTTSHVALLARALGIPAVVGLGDITARVQPGDFVLLDGTKGTVTVNPDGEARAAFDAHARRERELRAQLVEDRAAPD